MKKIKGKQIIWGTILLILATFLAILILNWEDAKAGMKDGSKAAEEALRNE